MHEKHIDNDGRRTAYDVDDRAPTFNAQTYIDARVIASFVLWMDSMDALSARSYSAVLKEIITTAHDIMVPEEFKVGMPSEALKVLASRGFNIQQFKERKRGQGMRKHLSAEHLQDEFGARLKKGATPNHIGQEVRDAFESVSWDDVQPGCEAVAPMAPEGLVVEEDPDGNPM